MGLFSAIKNIFKSSGDDTSSSCCADGVCTCGAAEQADEVINELLQDKRSNVVNPDGSFEEVRTETQPGRVQAPPAPNPDPKKRKPKLSQKQEIEQEMEQTATAINEALENAAEADRNDASITATHVNKAPKTATKKPKASAKKATAKKATTTKAKTTKKRSTAKKAK